MRRTIIGVAATALALAACGSSGGGATPATTAAAATATTAEAATATTATATTAKAATATTAAAATVTTAGAAAAAGSAVTLKEYSVDAGAVKAGAVTLAVKNTGEFPHELLIVKADSFASLAKDANGGLDETKATIVAKTSRIEGGASASLTATLEAGKYVFVCNLGQGGNNHAAKGQHLDVTVG